MEVKEMVVVVVAHLKILKILALEVKTLVFKV